MARVFYARERGDYVHSPSYVIADELRDVCAQRLQLVSTYKHHNGCVNTISWADDGSCRIVSSGDDRRLVVSDAITGDLLHAIDSNHRGNVFAAKFIPGTNNRVIVSCASAGTIEVDDLDEPDSFGKRMFLCHTGGVYDVAVVPGDPNSFLSCGEDGCVRWFDLRERRACASKCTKDVCVKIKGAGTCAIEVNPSRPSELAVGCTDSLVRIYDLRQLSRPSTDSTGYIGLVSLCCLPYSHSNNDVQSRRHRRVTSIAYDHHSQLLVNFSCDDIYMFDTSKFLPPADKYDTSALDGARGGVRALPRRVRLRGDWSDTGPSTDNGQEDESSQLLQRLGELIGNYIVDRASNREDEPFLDASDYFHDSDADEFVDANETQPEEVDVPVLRPDGIRKVWTSLMNAVDQCTPVERFTGHRNARTILKQAAFWSQRHIVAGSDCGHVFLWRRPVDRSRPGVDNYGTVVLVAVGDARVVNCVQPHPVYPVLATSGIQYDIKVWFPTAQKPFDDQQYIDTLTTRNANMLRETQDTVTVPGLFMLRLMAMARNRRNRLDEADEADADDDDEDLR